jgi:hypothetical protein
MTHAEWRLLVTIAIEMSQEPWKIQTAHCKADGTCSSTLKNLRSGKVSEVACGAPFDAPSERQLLLDGLARSLASR